MIPSWLPALEDTEKSIKAFFSSCISAGPSLCALANFNGPNTTATDLLDAFNDALQALIDDPILAPPVLAASTWNPTPGNPSSPSPYRRWTCGGAARPPDLAAGVRRPPPWRFDHPLGLLDFL